MGVCARCAGVYVGLFAGAAYSLLPLPGAAPSGPVRRGLLVALLLPVVLHPLAAGAGLAPDFALLRAATGLLAGAAAGRLLPHALAGAFVRRPAGSGGSPRDARPPGSSLALEPRTGRI